MCVSYFDEYGQTHLKIKKKKKSLDLLMTKRFVVYRLSI